MRWPVQLGINSTSSLMLGNFAKIGRAAGAFLLA